MPPPGSGSGTRPRRRRLIAREARLDLQVPAALQRRRGVTRLLEHRGNLELICRSPSGPSWTPVGDIPPAPGSSAVTAVSVGSASALGESGVGAVSSAADRGVVIRNSQVPTPPPCRAGGEDARCTRQLAADQHRRNPPPLRLLDRASPIPGRQSTSPGMSSPVRHRRVGRPPVDPHSTSRPSVVQRVRRVVSPRLRQPGFRGAAEVETQPKSPVGNGVLDRRGEHHVEAALKTGRSCRPRGTGAFSGLSGEDVQRDVKRCWACAAMGAVRTPSLMLNRWFRLGRTPCSPRDPGHAG